MQKDEQIIKQVVGIDVSKDSLEVSFGTLSSHAEKELSVSISFSNNVIGFRKLLSWTKKNKVTDTCPVVFVMEATGVYYENLAYFLNDHQEQVVVLLPNKTKNYAKTLDLKSKTDKIDSRMLTQFGLERKFNLWHVPTPLLKDLKILCREYSSMTKTTVQIKNQLHAKGYSYKPPKGTVSRLKQQLKFSERQLTQIEQEIEELLSQDPDLNGKINKIAAIKGVGIMTAIRVVAETNGFALIENGKQLASYVGLDVVHNQSGNRERKSSISRKGNKFIRQALYMPAICACRYDKTLKDYYIRLAMRKNIKKIAVVAAERKLLLLIYTLWKNNSQYDPDYLLNKNNHQHKSPLIP
ncbi:MAG: IS110 family transposase [Bacteroidetes bacterium]|nr:IS110 family transposase [Bacteroidota bacterium]